MINWTDPVRRGHPLNQGLRAWWLVTPGNRGGTLLRDITRGGNHAFLTNRAASSGRVPRSLPGGWGAVDLDGGDDFINIPAPNPLLTEFPDPITVSLWFFSRQATSAQSGLVDLTTNGTTNTRCNIFTTSSNLRFRIDVSGTNQDVTVANPLVQSAWNHVACTYAKGRQKIYHNAVEVASGTGTGTMSTHSVGAATSAIGKLFALNWEANGIFDDVRVLHAEWSAGSVAEYYRLSQNGYQGLFNLRIARAGLFVPGPAGSLDYQETMVSLPPRARPQAVPYWT